MSSLGARVGNNIEIKLKKKKKKKRVLVGGKKKFKFFSNNWPKFKN